ncbi:MAG: RNA polymerase sigma factor region1.1 domain-containing protein, partial [Deltaproteobacteria bacterium]|nr:RNA polymerase sigma factor region1.1 domain-containing protein [Deltaproteobacteria bacterium]
MTAKKKDSGAKKTGGRSGKTAPAKPKAQAKPKPKLKAQAKPKPKPKAQAKPKNKKKAPVKTKTLVEPAFEGLKRLMSQGRKQGFVTYEQISEVLPHRAFS